MNTQFVLRVAFTIGLSSISLKAIDKKSAIIPFIPPYITHQLNVHKLFEQGIEARNEVIMDPLFACRNSKDAHIIEFLYENTCSFTKAINRLFKLAQKVEYAIMYVNLALEKYPIRDKELINNCQTLLHDLGQLSSELKLFIKRLMHTKNWAHETCLSM